MAVVKASELDSGLVRSSPFGEDDAVEADAAAVAAAARADDEYRELLRVLLQPAHRRLYAAGSTGVLLDSSSAEESLDVRAGAPFGRCGSAHAPRQYPGLFRACSAAAHALQ